MSQPQPTSHTTPETSAFGIQLKDVLFKHYYGASDDQRKAMVESVKSLIAQAVEQGEAASVPDAIQQATVALKQKLTSSTFAEPAQKRGWQQSVDLLTQWRMWADMPKSSAVSGELPSRTQSKHSHSVPTTELTQDIRALVIERYGFGHIDTAGMVQALQELLKHAQLLAMKDAPNPQIGTAKAERLKQEFGQALDDLVGELKQHVTVLSNPDMANGFSVLQGWRRWEQDAAGQRAWVKSVDLSVPKQPKPSSTKVPLHLSELRAEMAQYARDYAARDDGKTVGYLAASMYGNSYVDLLLANFAEAKIFSAMKTKLPFADGDNCPALCDQLKNLTVGEEKLWAPGEFLAFSENFDKHLKQRLTEMGHADLLAYQGINRG